MKTYRIPRTDITVSRLAYGCGMLSSLASPKPPVGEGHSQEEIDKFKAEHSAEEIARAEKEPLSEAKIARAVEMVNLAVDHGITLFDHADVYSFGKSEEAFGAALKRSPGLRDKVV